MVLQLLSAISLATLGGGSEPSATPAFRMELNGLEIIEDGVGTTGRSSSYHGRSLDHDVFFGLPEYDDERIRFSGRLIPAAGSRFDEGVLGYRIDGDNLVVAVAAGIDARDWCKGDSGNLIGQGDLFVTVRQGEEINQFALLNDLNDGRSLGNQGRWRAARVFRYGDDTEVGHAVLLTSEDNLTKSGGDQGHARGVNSPAGLDERVFACGGEDTGVGSVKHYSFDAIQPLDGRETVSWYVSEWTVPLVTFGDEEAGMELAFHVAPSCGNDQINGKIKLPGKGDKEGEKPPKKRKKAIT